jgi:hypothetical protein
VTKYNEGLNQTDRVFIEGTWHAADFPESLASWQRFASEDAL